MSRESYGMQQIDQKLTHLLKPLFQGSKKEFIMINNLVKNWQEIIGKKYAEFCYPKTVQFSKDRASGAKLTIAVYNSAVGFFLENNSEIIIERIASFYGFKSISKIIIKQEPKDINSNKAREIKLPEAQEKNLQEKISEIEDKDLAETLQNLGRDVFKKTN
jgi:hypothetical protein